MSAVGTPGTEAARAKAQAAAAAIVARAQIAD